MKEILKEIVRSYVKESHSTIITKYNCYALEIISPTYNSIQIPPKLTQPVIDIPHSSLTTCNFCNERKYIKGFKFGDNVFCANCVNRDIETQEYYEKNEINILYHRGFLKTAYISHDLIMLEIFLKEKEKEEENPYLEKNQEDKEKENQEKNKKENTFSREIISIKLREVINKFADYDILSTTRYQDYHNYSCESCDTLRKDLFFKLYLQHMCKRTDVIVCVNCYKNILGIKKYRLLIKFLLLNEISNKILVNDVLLYIKKIMYEI
jgi:hypothetical protein